MWVEQAPRSILEMATASVNFPRLRFTETPKFYQTVVTGGDDVRSRGMKSNPIDTPVVSLKYELDHGVGISEHVGLLSVRSSDLIFKRHGGGSRVFLSQARDVPNTYRLIERGGDDQIILGVKLRTHNIVVVTSHGAD